MHARLLLLLLPLSLGLGSFLAQETSPRTPPAQEALSRKEIEAQLAKLDRPWLTLLDRASLTAGIYRLPKGSTDAQEPHRYDEVYYVIGGKGMLTAGEEEWPMHPGAVAYVARDVEHRFHSIEEDLEVLVFFSKHLPK